MLVNKIHGGIKKMIEAVIFDWAGTTVDYGCFAPVQAFIYAFEQYSQRHKKEKL